MTSKNDDLCVHGLKECAECGSLRKPAFKVLGGHQHTWTLENVWTGSFIHAMVLCLGCKSIKRPLFFGGTFPKGMGYTIDGMKFSIQESSGEGDES
jgi:hypothetical protein